MSDIAELREKNVQDLQNQLHDLLKEQFQLRMQMSGGQLADISQIKKTRRSIARIKTLIREKTGSAK